MAVIQFFFRFLFVPDHEQVILQVGQGAASLPHYNILEALTSS